MKTNNYKVVNLNDTKNIKYTLFPDNAPHVNVSVREGEDVVVICSLTDSLKMMQLVLAVNAIDHSFGHKKLLYIPYLMGARFDRVMNPGDSFDLEAISGIINSFGFEKVVIFDPHSDVATALIKNSVAITNEVLVRQYQTERSILILPDAGAAKKVSKYLSWNKNIVDIVFCTKERDLSNGQLTLKVLDPEKCRGRNCVVVDDLCDAGGTFLGIASQIEPADLTLIVSHGLFSKGLGQLSMLYDVIISTNSTQRYDVTATDDHLKILDANDLWLTL